MAGQDFYQVLGVSKTASAEEIRKSYRKLAKENHPDARPDDKQAAERFKQIQEAYDVLSDPDKRKRYDQFGHDFYQRAGAGGGPDPRQNPFGGGGGAPFDFEDLFGGGGAGGFDFGDLFGAGGPRGGSGRRTMRGSDVKSRVSVPFETAARGGTIDLSIEGGRETLSVKIPAGIEEGSVIRLAGQGEPSPRGGEPGDLLLTVHIDPHRYMRREGKDLFVDVPITPAEAVLGAKVDVPTLSEGQVVMTIPPGTSSGMKLRLRGKGVSDPKSNAPGDQYAVIKIVVPKESAPETRALYEQIARTNPPNPRQGLW